MNTAVASKPVVRAVDKPIIISTTPPRYLAYRIFWTEYESGMGQRPDGVSYAFLSDPLEQHKAKQEKMGDYSCFIRASALEQVCIGPVLMGLIQNNKGIYTTMKHPHENDLGLFLF